MGGVFIGQYKTSSVLLNYHYLKYKELGLPGAENLKVIARPVN